MKCAEGASAFSGHPGGCPALSQALEGPEVRGPDPESGVWGARRRQTRDSTAVLCLMVWGRAEVREGFSEEGTPSWVSQGESCDRPSLTGRVSQAGGTVSAGSPASTSASCKGHM